MKLPDFSTFLPFNNLRAKMGADRLGEFDLTLNWEIISMEEVAQLQEEGIDVEAKDIRFLNDGTIAYKNRRVLLYIRDWKLDNDRNSLPRFHIVGCSTLEQMIRHNRFQRYVVATRTDGIFKINLINSSTGSVLKKDQELDVCKNCLWKLNYNNYKGDRVTAFKTFALEEFFVRFACSPITVTPLETDRTAPLSVYSKDWNKMSKEYKKRANWRCERCGRDFGGRKTKFLQAHHKNGNTFDNRPSNIEVLCIICHSKEPYHGQLKQFPLYKEYEEESSLDEEE